MGTLLSAEFSLAELSAQMLSDEEDLCILFSYGIRSQGTEWGFN